jgi:hypothetical protein
MPHISKLIGVPNPSPDANSRSATLDPPQSNTTRTEGRTPQAPVVVAIPPKPTDGQRVQLADANAPLQVAIPSTSARVSIPAPVAKSPPPAAPVVVAQAQPIQVAQNELTPPRPAPVVKPVAVASTASSATSVEPASKPPIETPVVAKPVQQAASESARDAVKTAALP